MLQRVSIPFPGFVKFQGEDYGDYREFQVVSIPFPGFVKFQAVVTARVTSLD